MLVLFPKNRGSDDIVYGYNCLSLDDAKIDDHNLRPRSPTRPGPAREKDALFMMKRRATALQRKTTTTSSNHPLSPPSPSCNIIHFGEEGEALTKQNGERKHILCFNAAEIGQQHQHLIHQHLATPHPVPALQKIIKTGKLVGRMGREQLLFPPRRAFVLRFLLAILLAAFFFADSNCCCCCGAVAVASLLPLLPLQFGGLSAIFTTPLEV